MKSLYELTGTSNTASWIPEDAYADLILEASVCYGQLSGVITAIDYDLKACQGATIQIRYIGARTAQGPISEWGCLSEASSTFGTYPITVKQYGDYDKLSDFSILKTCGPLKDRILNEMAKGLAKKRDSEIWTALKNASAGYTATLAHAWSAGVVTDSCCFDAVDLYNKIVYLYKQMQGNAYNPDVVIMHPTVAAHLYYKDNGNIPIVQNIMPLVKFDNAGQLVSIGPLKVIESCVATSGTTVSGATLAIVIDSSRAIGEAWGKRPTFSEFYDNVCNVYKETVWMYWGTAAMDTNAIGRIRNP